MGLMPEQHSQSRSPMPPGLGPRRGSSLSTVSGVSGQSKSSVNSRTDLELVFVDGLDKRFECPVCCQVLRYPVQFEDCGHRCCSSCLPELLRVAPRCPIDQSTVDRDKVYVDKAFTREIDKLQVKCSNHSKGCKWTGALNTLVTHNESCKYVTVPCPQGCGLEFEKKFVKKHIQNDCAKREISCEFCQIAYNHDEEIDHLNVCTKFLVPCPNGCKKKELPRDELENHMENDCAKQRVPCPFSNAGCEHKCDRKEMKVHVRDDQQEHLSLVMETLKANTAQLETTGTQLEEHSTRLDSGESRMSTLEKLYGSQLVWKIDRYEDKLAEAKAGKKPTVFSPPFLTSRHGYKLALSACLYGEGKARGKFMSLFVCICRGEYDPLLLWPFCHRVTLTLVDQCQDPSARRNITYSMKPNTCKENKQFLGRPVGERNASFGAAKFCELSALGSLDYVRDDTIFIKVDIDSEDMIML